MMPSLVLWLAGFHEGRIMIDFSKRWQDFESVTLNCTNTQEEDMRDRHRLFRVWGYTKKNNLGQFLFSLKY